MMFCLVAICLVIAFIFFSVSFVFRFQRIVFLGGGVFGCLAIIFFQVVSYFSMMCAGRFLLGFGLG